MKLKLFLLASVVLIIISSCAKQGPVGPAGPQGPQGDTGVTGKSGTNGTNGVTNIKTSIFTITSWTTINPGVTYRASLADPSITVADSDAVEVGVDTVGSGSWIALSGDNILTNGDRMDYQYVNGFVNVSYLFTSAPVKTLYFKVTVIPPAMAKKRH